MISNLPRLIWVSIWILAFMAGIVNVVGLIGFGHEAFTHLTGSSSRLAEAIATHNLQQTVHVTALIGAFIIGTTISGYTIQGEALELNKGYGIVLLLEALLLLISVPLLRSTSDLGAYCAACACGLQNAMVSTYSGAIVRTTHVSGMFTDLGIAMGRILRGVPINQKRVSLCLNVISGFIAGGIFGTLVFKTCDYGALYFPALLSGLMALCYRGKKSLL